MEVDQGNEKNLFGLNCTYNEASLVGIPVPIEWTTSYGGGAALGPHEILKASPQLDLYDHDFGPTYKSGIYLINDKDEVLPEKWAEITGSQSTEETSVSEINRLSEKAFSWVKHQAESLLLENKTPFVLGGDHSAPLGLIQALADLHQGAFGILQIDAHADLREAYQGYKHSHASIMYNALDLSPRIQNLTQVGIRDYSEEEKNRIDKNPDRIRCFYDREMKKRLHRGETWQTQCEEIVGGLPELVYVSFDIDGLSPEFCPGTGTPVPGGLSFDHAVELLVTLAKFGRKVIGFDLCEVAPSKNSEWDGNVGARVLYKLCGTTLASRR